MSTRTLLYAALGLIALATAYEATVYVVNRREGDLHEDARKERLRKLGQRGDEG